MLAGSVAKRYARALIELAKEAGTVPEVLSELERVEAMLKQSEMLQHVLASPLFSRTQRLAVLRELLSAAALSELTRRFLLLLGTKNRFSEFGAVVREYRAMNDSLEGIVRVTLSSAVPLPKAIEDQLVTAIERRVQRKVHLTREVNPALIGGLMTRIGDLLLDGSLSTQLARLRTSLAEEQLG